MPLFYSQPCGTAADGKINAIAGCKTQPLVAVAREPKAVVFYNDQVSEDPFI